MSKTEFEKGSRVCNKSKGTSNQIKTVRNSYVTKMHQPITVVQIKHSLAHVQDLIPTLVHFITYIFNTSQSRN